MGEACASFTQGILAYNNIDLIPNGFINEIDVDRDENEIRLLPSSRLAVELQYSIRSDITGTSLNDLSPGGNTGFLLGGLGGGAGFGLGAALGCSLLGDIEPTHSQFVFHVCESNTKINKTIPVTQEMLDVVENTDNPDNIVEYEFTNEYILGVLGVTSDSLEFTDEEIETIGSTRGVQRGHNITQEGQIQADFSGFKHSGDKNLFIEIVRDERKFQYRADNNIPGDDLAGANAFTSGSPDDLTDRKIKFKFPVFLGEDFEGPVEDESLRRKKLEIGDSIYITMVSTSNKIVRHAIFVSSFFFLFPNFIVERIGIDHVKAWSFRPFRFKAHKDASKKATLEDFEHDAAVDADEKLFEEDKEKNRRLEFIESQRVVECVNDTKNKSAYIRGFYFADTRGILSFDVRERDFEPKLLIPAEDIRDQSWWTSFIQGHVDFGPGYNDKGELDVTSIAANRVLKGFVFDISDHVNAVCYDNDKFGYQRDLASAIKNVSSFDSNIDGTGIGFPNLDLIRLSLSLRHKYDLSSAKFEPYKMSSVEGGAYFVRDCNKIFTYDQQFCASGTLQADMFIRTPIIFDEYGRDARIYIERFTPQFALERDGGIWVTTRPAFAANMAIDTHYLNHEAMMIFGKEETLNYFRFNDFSSRYHLSKSESNTSDTSRSHETPSFASLSQNDVQIVGFDQLISNQPGYSKGLEITREKGKILRGIETDGDVYETVVAKHKSGDITFVQNLDTGEVNVQGLQSRRIRTIQLFYKPLEDFRKQDFRYLSFIFPNNRFIIDNVALGHAGGDSGLEQFVIVDSRYYYDDVLRIAGDILEHMLVTKIVFTIIKEEKYQENFIDTNRSSIVFDISGKAYIFYEDSKANEGEYELQDIEIPAPGGQGPSSFKPLEVVDGGTIEISCLISHDMGTTWVDHKGVVPTFGDEIVRTPFAIADKRSNIIHLFYVLNNNLMHKSIQPSLFVFEDSYKAWKRPVIYNETTPDNFGTSHFSGRGQQLRTRISSVVIGNTGEGSYLLKQFEIDIIPTHISRNVPLILFVSNVQPENQTALIIH